MNILKLNKFSLVALASILTMVSCSDSKQSDPSSSNIPSGAVEVEITTNVLTKANVTTEYSNGDEMNLFVKTYKSIESDDKFRNVKAEYQNGYWKTTPQVYLKSGELVFLYAVSPFNSEYTNGAAIPVDVSKQIDLLYSGANVPVNFQTPKARLEMKHAMALASFNIEGAESHTLNSISIIGSAVYTKATFNVETGKFKGVSKDQFILPCANQLSQSGWTSGYPQMWVVPFNTKTSKATLSAVIDGKTYLADFPEVEMKNGFQYIFRLVFTDLGLEFIPSRTETISLNVATDDFGELNDYGMLKLSVNTSKFRIPSLIGNGVFGKVRIGDNIFSYLADEVQNVSLSSGVNNVVEIETWNSTGFTIETLEGVEVIDISDY